MFTSNHLYLMDKVLPACIFFPLLYRNSFKSKEYGLTDWAAVICLPNTRVMSIVEERSEDVVCSDLLGLLFSLS